MHWIRGEALGRGGFAFVSKGIITSQQDGIPHIVAVKSSKSSESDSLVKEKKLLDRFNNCPFIIRCFGDDTTEEDGQMLYNIFLEYASGGCLADIIKSNGRGLPEPAVKNHTRSILMALSHMHTLGYVHCDIKPHNILIVEEGDERMNVKNSVKHTAKLADLGSAINMRGGEDNGDDGGFRGTVLYAAPESIINQTYVPQSDVWSLGCTVLFMLTGKSPWKFESPMTATDVMMTIGCSDQIPEIPSTKKISKDAVDFLKKCFVKDPRSRCSADMLLDHPFVRNRDAPVTGKCSSHSRHHHHHRHYFTSRLSHGISSFVHSCFHVHDLAAVGQV
ncbi:mitogen-activated protein kinase kinase kinase 2-like [Dorcoceras hygrometricum]|uniref:Mitogen-activated protein kinase kinase kinase 2-like n=1 Tax=Dorcoceras hygrometricum TaxID=472368 RepID=A0A2Z7CRG2_9LAMI|nr:mitogen-activated protein kinase kinase kinase 2-like [Dorcoceras hygrometricum]